MKQHLQTLSSFSNPNFPINTSLVNWTIEKKPFQIVNQRVQFRSFDLTLGNCEYSLECETRFFDIPRRRYELPFTCHFSREWSFDFINRHTEASKKSSSSLDLLETVVAPSTVTLCLREASGGGYRRRFSNTRSRFHRCAAASIVGHENENDHRKFQERGKRLSRG